MIKKKGSDYQVLDSSGNKVLGTHPTYKKALDQLQAIEASKHANKYADGGVKEDNATLRALAEKYSNIPVSKDPKKVLENSDKLTEQFDKIYKQNPQAALIAKNMYAKAMGITPGTGLDIDLDKGFYERIRGANPTLEVPQLVPGQREVINDINRVSGKVPAEMSAVVNATPSALDEQFRVKGVTDKIPTERIISKTGEEFVEDNAEKLAKTAAKRAALQGIKTGSKKLLGMVPFVGGLATAAMSGDASAALPIPESAPLGYADQSPEAQLEKGKITPDEYSRLRALVKRK